MGRYRGGGVVNMYIHTFIYTYHDVRVYLCTHMCIGSYRLHEYLYVYTYRMYIYTDIDIHIHICIFACKYWFLVYKLKMGRASAATGLSMDFSKPPAAANQY